MNNRILLVAVMAAVTALLRFLPFLIFHGNKKTPPFIEYLGKVLPYAIMGMLVVFCLKSVDLKSGMHGIPEFISCAVIVFVHWKKRNTILSILSGTLCYILITNFLPL